MKRHLLLALLLALLLTPLSLADEKDKPDTPKDDTLAKELKDLRTQFDEFRRLSNLSASATRADLKSLAEQLDRIEKRLDRMATSGSTISRSSFYSPAATTTTGTIKLDNRLGVRAQVTIDGITYEVPPLAVRYLRDQPAGAFIYEVTADGLGITPPKRTTLSARGTMTLTIH